jgi:ketosteroid isomerase-like protein
MEVGEVASKSIARPWCGRLSVGLVALGSVLAAACAAPVASGCATRAPDDTLRAIIAADNARDLSEVMRHYTSDVTWLPPGREPTLGEGAVRDAYAALYSDTRPALSLTVEHVEHGAEVAAVWGYTSGTLAPAHGDAPARQVNDAYLATLRCESGHWRVQTMMWHGR